MRPIVEYACRIWHVGLPQYLQKAVETIQRRILTTIYGLAPYEEHLSASGLVSLTDRRVKICSDLLNEMYKPDHKLNHLFPKSCECSKSMRNAPPIDPPKFRTNHCRDTFIIYALIVNSVDKEDCLYILSWALAYMAQMVVLFQQL